MLVHLGKCRYEALEYELDLDLARSGRGYPEFAEIPTPRVRGRLVAQGNKFVTSGVVEARIQAVCVRCLVPFSVGLARNYEIVFVPAAEAQASEENDSVVNEVPFQGEEIDLLPVLVEQFHLSIPMRFLCSQDCQGLCPRCGAGRNEATCVCKDEPRDPRFEVLKSLIQ